MNIDELKQVLAGGWKNELRCIELFRLGMSEAGNTETLKALEDLEEGEIGGDEDEFIDYDFMVFVLNRIDKSYFTLKSIEEMFSQQRIRKLLGRKKISSKKNLYPEEKEEEEETQKLEEQ